MQNTIFVAIIMVAVFAAAFALLYALTTNQRQTQKRIESFVKTQKEYANEALEKSFTDRYFGWAKRLFISSMNESSKKVKINPKDKTYNKLINDLKVVDGPLTPAAFMTIKTMTTVICLAIAAGVGYVFLRTNMTYFGCVVAVGAIIGMKAPNFILTQVVKKRKQVILDELPNVIDLLCVSVEAGLGFDAALMKLYSKNPSSPLLKELNTSVKDIQMGLSRKQAFRGVCDRCQVQELTAFCTAVVQAEELGVAIKSVLASQALQLRETRKQKAEQAAAKTPVKMMIPTVLLIFPVIFIVLLGPAVMQVMDSGVL